MPDFINAEEVIADDIVAEAIRRSVFEVQGNVIKYRLGHERREVWTDPEEWVRAFLVAYLVVRKGYPAERIKLEVTVPRRLPTDRADVVVYREDDLRDIYLVAECKSAGQPAAARAQGIEQAFGNAIVLEAPFVLYEEGLYSQLYVRGPDTGYGPLEREANKRGQRANIPEQYGQAPVYALFAGSPEDIRAPSPANLEARIRRAHALIWAGGRRDPLNAFDEWSKLLFAKVADERTTPTGQPRRFQVGAMETNATVATRVHRLFEEARLADPSIFPPSSRISLPDSKVCDVVAVLQELAFTRTDVDTIGSAFERFFGSVFRGGLGQYFTMRQLARFTVGMLDVSANDFVLDPTAGSGGFLLEVLLQVWHRIDDEFAGQPPDLLQRRKTDFALQHVFGVEIHEILARICKINLLLHHDGHTNVEANRSVLDSTFDNRRVAQLNNVFSRIVGNPPFGTDIKAGDEEQLGTSNFRDFELTRGFNKVESEHLVLERCVNLLDGGGRFGLIIPDGTLNNQGFQSNCPQMRSFLAKHGRIYAIVSLPDHAFRKSGAQNKTSILFFEKFSREEKRRFDTAYARLVGEGHGSEVAIPEAIVSARLDYHVFLGEADHVGYTPAGAPSNLNDLYADDANDRLVADQTGTILGEYRAFTRDPSTYTGSSSPDCAGILFSNLWRAHPSHRLDPKYHLFKQSESDAAPAAWVRDRLGNVLRRREERGLFNGREDELFTVLTIAQNGTIRRRPEAKGNNPPEWRGSYFQDSPGDWYVVHAGDLVYSSIDLWKGCISIVPPSFDGALVSKEFPIYRVADERLSSVFLQTLLRSRFYQRAFRAITTGHSNRRRTQKDDFENLEIAFPPDQQVQEQLTAGIRAAKAGIQEAEDVLRRELMAFNDLIDGRGDEALPELEADEEAE